MKHLDLRAEERYSMGKLNENAILKDIQNGKCVLMESNIEKYSHCFMVKVQNKYLKIVTDFDVRFVKTTLPYTFKDFDFVCELVDKLNEMQLQAA